jgi:hypothetical protein
LRNGLRYMGSMLLFAMPPVAVKYVSILGVFSGV